MTKRDVIVTIPRSRGGCAHLEEKIEASRKEDWDVRWEFTRLPKDLRSGSKLYIICEGFIRGFFIVKQIGPDPIQGKYLMGDFYEVYLKDWTPLQPPIPFKVRGFQYITEEILQ